MTQLLLLLLSSSALTPAAPSLVAPAQLVSGADGSTSGSVVTSSVAPTNGALVIVHIAARADHEADVTVTGLSAGFSIDGTWTIVQKTHFNASTSRWVSAITAMARAASSAGSGVVTVTFSLNAWSKCYSVEEITAGASAAIGSYPYGGAGGTATTLSLTLSPSPAASSYLLGASGHEGTNVGAWGFPTGWTTRTVITQASNLSLKVGYKAPPGAAANDLSGLDNSEATAWMVTEVKQA